MLSFAPTPEGDERPVAERGASAGPSKTSYSGSSGYSGPPFNEVEEGKCRYCPMREAIDGTWKADNLDDCKQACADKPSCKRIVFWAKNKGCGLYTTCEPKKCGKRWRQRLKQAVYEIERPAGAACTLENLENIKNLKPDQLPIDCKEKELKTLSPLMSGRTTFLSVLSSFSVQSIGR